MPRLKLKKVAKLRLASLPRQIQDALDEALLELQANPTEAGRPLRGVYAGRWRMVVGQSRVIYRIREGTGWRKALPRAATRAEEATMQTHYPPYWQAHLCGALGAPARPENVRFLTGWGVAEGGTAEWNPLNTTFELPGATDYNSSGVKNYPRPTWGVCATALTLTNGFYGRIVGHLQAGTYTAEQIVEDCRDQISKWGTNPDAILAALKEIS